MPQKYFQHSTPATVLRDGAKKIYAGRRFSDPKTNQVYEFLSFMDYCVDGQVRVRNISKGKTELLTYKQWYSLLEIAQKSQPKPRSTPPKFSREGHLLLEAIERLDKEEYEKLLGPGFSRLETRDLVYINDRAQEELARRKSAQPNTPNPKEPEPLDFNKAKEERDKKERAKNYEEISHLADHLPAFSQKRKKE